MAELEGAFDATRRKGLIYKIYKAGVKGMLLTILDSYLTNRFSRNLVNGYASKWFESNYRLPQGSILSPVLLILLSPTENFLIAPLNIYPMNPSVQTTTTYGEQQQHKTARRRTTMGSKHKNAVVPKMEDKHKQTKNTGHSI